MIHDGNYKLLPGEPCPKFELVGCDDTTYKLESFEKDVVVLVFMCNHCPYVHAIEEDLKKFTEEYAGKVDVVGINGNDAHTHPQDSFKEMKKRVSERGFNFTYLHDQDQSFLKEAGAALTPQIMALDKKRQAQYQGNMSGLREAVDAMLADKPVPHPVLECEGCSVKWKA